MNKYDIIGGMLGIVLVMGVATAIHYQKQKELDKEMAEAKAHADEAFEELANTIKTVDEMNKDLDLLLKLSKERLEDHKMKGLV